MSVLVVPSTARFEPVTAHFAPPTFYVMYEHHQATLFGPQRARASTTPAHNLQLTHTGDGRANLMGIPTMLRFTATRRSSNCLCNHIRGLFYRW